MHTRKSVKRSRRRARLADPVEEFKLFSGDTLGGLRTAAGRLLKQTHDIDLSPDIKDALLYGSTLKPVKTGDFAQLETTGVDRRLKRQQPHIFIGGLKFTSVVSTQFLVYTPDRPEQLHRIHISNITASGTVAFARDLKTLGGFQPPLFWGNRVPALDLFNPIDFGEIGVLLTPANPLFMSVDIATTIFVSLQLSTAQIA